MSSEDWSLNGKITRTGSGESETAASDETGYNGGKISKNKPKGEQKVIFFSSSDKLNNSSWSRDLEISRITSGLTSETKCKFTTLLCAPPQIFVVAERNRIDLAISPTYSGVTASNIQNKPKSNRLGCRIFNRTSCLTYGYFFTFQITLRRSGAIGYSLNFGTFGSNFGTSRGNFETFLSCTNPLLRAPPK